MGKIQKPLHHYFSSAKRWTNSHLKECVDCNAAAIEIFDRKTTQDSNDI